MSPMRAVARRGDPSTSWAAADSLPSDHIRQSQRLVLGVLQDYGPMVDERLLELVPTLSPSGARSRRAELVDLGLVYDTGERVRLASGRRGIVWGARWVSPTPPSVLGL